ncbi:MAG: hypothetical protein IJS90_05430, partial [Clostridia bacterium]|nr:hypothetical protein [Clostridia bacterium]
MKLLGTEFTYFCGGIKYIDRSEDNPNFKLEYAADDKKITAKVTAKKKLTMHRADIDFEFVFEPTDKFFGNGYQSWTTSREYTVNDKMKAVIPIAKGRLENLAGISADTRFVEFPKEAGSFVSHCYTYVKRGKEVILIGSLTEKQGF